MFETSVVRARTDAVSGRLSLLTISIIAHSAVVVGAITVSIASIDFPTTAPDEYRAAPELAVVSIPRPFGTPEGSRRQEQQPARRPEVTPPPTQITAPPSVPDTVIPVAAQATGNSESSREATANIGPWGRPDGDPNSIATDLEAPSLASVTPGEESRIYEKHEVTPPVLLQRIDPPYPPILVRTGVAATVVVRCIIDKNGRVRDPQVIVPSRFESFNEAVVNAVQQWRYTPGSRKGEAVETYLNVTVYFSVKR